MHKQHEWWNEPIGVPYTTPSYQDWPRHFWDDNHAWRGSDWHDRLIKDWGYPIPNHKPKPMDVGGVSTKTDMIKMFTNKEISEVYITKDDFYGKLKSDSVVSIYPDPQNPSAERHRFYNKLGSSTILYAATIILFTRTGEQLYSVEHGL